jgi:hypothetical protein
VEETSIRVCATTGLVLDIWRTGPEETEAQGDKVNSVALRADMYGLPIPEQNLHLEY